MLRPVPIASPSTATIALNAPAAVSAFAALTPTLAPATHTNSYAIGSREVLLVEPATPYADEQREWLAWAHGLRSRGCSLVGLLATHHHPDHVGGLEVLARELNIELWAHPATAALIGWTRYRSIEDLQEFVLAGPDPIRVRALHTPGHAPGHLCLHLEAQALVLCGDMMAAVGSILIAPGDGDMAEYLAQLQRLAALGAHTALPAHGDPIPHAAEQYQALVLHRLRREARILACVPAARAAAYTVAQLVALAYADTSPDLWPIAELSLRSHLIKLEGEGRVERAEDRYCRSGRMEAA